MPIKRRPITRTDGIKVDWEENRFEKIGIEHDGRFRVFDRKTGKEGYYDRRNKRFFGDVEEESFEDNADTGPSYSEIISDTWKKGSQEISDVFHQTNKDFLKGILGFFGVITGGVAAATYARQMAKHPEDPTGAMKKAGRNASCVLGIVGVIVAVFVITLVFVALADVLGSYANLIYNIVLFACGYTIFGLIRIMCDRTFFISIPKTIQKIRTTHVPVIAYIGIVIASVVFLFEPLMNFFDRLTMDWFEANKDSFTYIQKVAMALGMAGISLILSALAGGVLCLLVKWITAKINSGEQKSM